MIISISSRNSQSTSDESFQGLSKEIQSLGLDLQEKIVSLQASVESSTEKRVSYLYLKLSKSLKEV